MRAVEINLAPFKLESDSLLTVILKAAPFPVHQAIAYGFRRALEMLKSNAQAKLILRRPFSEIGPSDINELFKFIEDDIALSPEINHYGASVHARRLLTWSGEKLANGQTIKQSGFKSRFKQVRASIGSGRPLKAPQLDAPLQLVPDKFNSLEERNEKALTFGQTIRDQICELCERTFDAHEKALEIIVSTRASGLPPLATQSVRGIANGKVPHPDTLAKLDSHDLLRVAVALASNKKWALEGREGYFPFVQLTSLTEFCLEPNAYTIVEILLSEYFLPRLVVTGCAIAILAYSALNLDVVSKLTLQNVVQRGTQILVTGVKGRSGQLISTEFSPPTASNDGGDHLRIDNLIAVRAIKLLIENAKKVKKLCGDENIPLLNTMRRKTRTYKWEPLDFYHSSKEFWDFHKMNRVPPSDLRRLCAHIMLLSPGESIFSVQVLLGHAKLSTTIEYVNTAVVADLLDANIRRFGDKLAATALFATGRGKSLKKFGLSESDIQPTLFPNSNFSHEKCAADAWLDSNGQIFLKMGVAEFRQCATQYHYYQKNFVALMNENPRRFSLVHLPRIFFCTAMREVMLTSPHAAIFKQFEQAVT